MEHVGYDTGKIHGTVHTQSYHHSIGTQIGGSRGVDVKKWHTYTVEWRPDIILFACDNEVYQIFKKQSATDKNKWPFDQKFYVILNMAVGGDWGGQRGIDEQAFRGDGQIMEVDWVRVEQKGSSVPARRRRTSTPAPAPTPAPQPSTGYPKGVPVYIRSHRNQMLQDHYGEAMLSGNPGLWEQWTIKDAGDGKVTIWSHRDGVLQDHYGEVMLSGNPGLWEQWIISDAGNDKVVIQSHRNQVLQDHYGEVMLSGNPGLWEQWSIIRA
jgi:hypothetical protein